MNTYKIHVIRRDSIYADFKFTAIFDSYDGAPIDHNKPSIEPIGYGDTEYEAMYDLLDNALVTNELVANKLMTNELMDSKTGRGNHEKSI